MNTYANLRELVEAVNSADEKTIVCMGSNLRDVADESRLKTLARDRIQGKLRGEGCVALPEVPQYQHEEVYVTRIGSRVDRLASALLRPSANGLKILRGGAGSSASVVRDQASLQEAVVAVEEAGRALASVTDASGAEDEGAHQARATRKD